MKLSVFPSWHCFLTNRDDAILINGNKMILEVLITCSTEKEPVIDVTGRGVKSSISFSAYLKSSCMCMCNYMRVNVVTWLVCNL